MAAETIPLAGGHASEATESLREFNDLQPAIGRDRGKSADFCKPFHSESVGNPRHYVTGS